MVNRLQAANLKLAVATSLLAVAAGCSSDAIRDPGRVQSEWAKTFRELAIVPTFPPREDFQVGDLYVTPYDPNSPELEAIFRKKWDDLTEDEKAVRRTIGMQVRLMQLPISGDLSTEYASRLSAPSSGFDPNRLDDVPAIAVAAVKLKEADDAVKAKVGVITTETTKLNAAQTAIDTAAAAAAAAKTAQDRAEKDLEDAVKAGPDLPKLRDAADKSAAAAAASEKAVTDKQSQIDSAADTATKTRLEAEMVGLKATRDKDKQAAKDATDAVNARTDLEAKAKTDKAAARAKEDALVTTKATQQTVIKAQQELIDKLNAELTGLKTKAADAKTQYDGLVAAAKLLSLSQPAYAWRDVYTGQKLAPGYGSTGNPSNVSRLRLVAFPDFITANFTGADAAAMIPIEAANLGIALSSQDVSGVSVKIPAAESYALPVGKMMPHVLDASRKLQQPIRNALVNYPKPVVAAKRDGDAKAAKPGRHLYVTVVTEVFYARAMDVSVTYSKAGAARLTGSLPGTTQPAGVLVGPTDSLQAMLNNVQSRVGQTQLVPGGSIQVVRGNSFGVGLRRTFDRPVAVGFRGFTVQHDPRSPDNPVPPPIILIPEVPFNVR